ncbi:MAG: 3'-5' exonuclease [Acidimicrobiaceae bacterium]|nr:3'-5' exonuclease [Acidimicrobiaceae bacterium]
MSLLRVIVRVMVVEPPVDQKQLDRMKSIEWCRRLLENLDDWCILDTETTGLKPRYSRVVEISVLSGRGELVMDTLIDPGVPIPQEVADIHGISDELVVGSPSIVEAWLQLQEVTRNKLVLAYNSSFDRGMLFYEAIRNDLPKLRSDWECVMVKYSAFVGIWNPRFGNYQYQKLPSAGHRSHLDCKVTLDLVYLMGESQA